MTDEGSTQPRVMRVSGETVTALAWIGPMLMLLAEAIGSGEILTEPVAGARYGGALLWLILLTIVTKAFWNEAIGRVSIVTGQNFLEACSGMGPPFSWVPWIWFCINLIKDFLLRGGIVAIAGLICHDVFGGLLPGAGEIQQQVFWTFLNFLLVWVILIVGGYRPVETFNTVMCLLFTLSLLICASFVAPDVTGELGRGLVPRMATDFDQLLVMMSLAGIVMAGSGTIKYSAWAEERGMGLLGHAREHGRLTREQFQPSSPEEVSRMRGWLRINRTNILLTYVLGLIVCMSTFILGVGILHPAGITLGGPGLARELSLMMTEVLGPWSRNVFYLGAWAAIISTAISIFDGSSRMFLQPLRMKAPSLFGKMSPQVWQKLILSAMMAGSWAVYAFFPKPVTLVLVMGAIDTPMIGIMMVAYAFLGRKYLPAEYRYGKAWWAGILLMGCLYLTLGVSYAFLKN